MRERPTNGSLVAVLENVTTDRIPCRKRWPSGRMVPPKMRVFADCLNQRLLRTRTKQRPCVRTSDTTEAVRNGLRRGRYAAVSSVALSVGPHELRYFAISLFRYLARFRARVLIVSGARTLWSSVVHLSNAHRS
ncbi:hypothetical protein [Burkholderia territorii]|uniref:hypothetical protein n=1 Tax=Burkholderia territorii TaxID=1503055 RepID=UPI0012DA59AA|nr:hypothetical protein [Burkholderia territorii]